MSVKSPAFQWYVNDFLGNMHVQLMTAAEVGAYTLLKNYCWSEDGLPADLNDLANLARMDIETFTNSWNKRISKCFEFDEKKNKFFCPQLREQAKKQKEFRIKKSNAGIASGRKRREIKQLGDEHLFNSVRTEHEHNDERVFNSVQTNDEQKRTLHTSSSSSYSSSSSNEEKEDLKHTQNARACVFDATTSRPFGSIRATQASDAEKQFFQTVHDGLCNRLAVTILPSQAMWNAALEFAWVNKFTADHVLETFDLLKKQRWRRGRISPKVLEENLTELEKLRIEIKEQENGTNQHGSAFARPQKQSAADIISQRDYYTDELPVHTTPQAAGYGRRD